MKYTKMVDFMIRIQDRIVKIDGLKVYYRTAGNPRKQTIIFLHGWAARMSAPSGLGIDKVISELAKHFYVVAPELPGLIRSQPPKKVLNMEDYSHLIHRLVKSLKVKRPIIMGQSWGGGISATYARLYPNNVRILILVDAKTGKRKDTFYLKLSNFWYFVFPKIIGSSWAPISIKKLLITAYLGTPWENISKNVKQYAIMSEISRYANKQMKVDYTKLKIPLLLVWGDRDTWVTPVESAREINRKVKGSKIIIVKGGHTVLYQRPKEVVALIVKNLPLK